MLTNFKPGGRFPWKLIKGQWIFLTRLTFFKPPIWVVLTRLIFESVNHRRPTREFQNRADLFNFRSNFKSAFRCSTFANMAWGHDDWWWNSRAAENSEYEINFAGYSFSSYWSSPPPHASTSQGFFSWPERNLSQSQSLAESEASESSSNTANYKKRTPWKSTEEEILISLRKERGSELKGSGSSQK